jgi:hypothetical protein
MIRDTDALIDLIRAVQAQAITDARTGYTATAALPDGEATVSAAQWLQLLGVPVAPIIPAPKPAPSRVTVPERCAADGEIYRRGRVAVALARGVEMVYTVTVDNAVVEVVRCKPQSWKRVQLEVLRAAETCAMTH